MPLPGSLARFNRMFLNKAMRPLALVAPGFGVLQHRGRRTGVVYRTPLNVFRDGDHLIVALTYGREVDWLKNARSAEESIFIVGGKPVRVGPPVHVSAEEGLAVIPSPVAAMLNIIDVTGFVAFPVID